MDFFYLFMQRIFKVQIFENQMTSNRKFVKQYDNGKYYNFARQRMYSDSMIVDKNALILK